MSTPLQSKIMNNVAREILKPMGVLRKGRSRIWLDDHGWWVTVVEFQPGRGSGSYLNIGVNLQWYPKEYFSFDMGYREETFHEYRSDEQFTPQAYKLVNKAKDRIQNYRNALSTVESTTKFVLNYKFSTPNDMIPEK